jgi:hypothetical protein
MEPSLIPIDNRRHVGWSPTSLLLWIAIAIILGSSAIVASPALAYRNLMGEMSSRESAEGAWLRLQGQADKERQRADHNQLAALTGALHKFLPDQIDRLHLYTEVRSSADLSGVVFRDVSFAEESMPLGPGGNGQWVYLALLNTSGEASPIDLQRMLDLLRLSGTTNITTAFNMSRNKLEQPTFHFQMQLGFPYYGPSASPSESALELTPTQQP